MDLNVNSGGKPSQAMAAHMRNSPLLAASVERIVQVLMRDWPALAAA